MLPNVGWLEDLTKPMIGRIWLAFLGLGHTMDVRLCTDPDFYARRGDTLIASGRVAPHLHIKLRVWNKGAPDVTIISWQPRVEENYTVDEHPPGPLVLESSGKPVTIDLVMRFTKMPFKVGDDFVMTLVLNNDVPKHFKTRVA
jgi:hypothetical protein